MRQNIKDFVAIVSESIPINEPIYEFGALQVPGQAGFADLRPLFPGKEYVGTDMRKGLGVDRLLDLHHIDLSPASVGTVLCLDTLEHVEYPSKALEEIHRILRPDGVAIISSVMNFPIHDHPNDYWRFTPEAFRSMLKPFSDSFIGFAGVETFPHTVVGIGFKGVAPNLDKLNLKYRQWQEHQVAPIKEVVKLLTPPILHPVLNSVYRAIYRLTRRSGWQ